MALRWLSPILLLAACLAAAGAADARIPGPAAATQLALMPLPQSVFGSEAAELKLDTDESGVEDNAMAADDSTTKSDTAASLTKAGRITGYSITFADFGLIGKAGHVVLAASGVVLYQGAKAASEGLKRDLADTEMSDPANGLHVLSVSRFDAPRLGDEAVGVHVKAKFGAAILWFTVVEVRRGELVEQVGVLRTDGNSEQAAVLDLAHALSVRVEDVLAGKVTTPAVKLPAEKKEKSAVVPAVKIDSGALTSGDLNGAKVTRSEYLKDSDTIAAYEREFDSTRYGKTRLLSAENDVSLYSSPTAASAFIAYMGGFFNPSNPSLESFLRKSFSENRAFKVTSVSVLRHRTLTVREAKGTELVLRVRTPLGPIDVVYAFVANGRLTSALIATSSFSAKIDLGDLDRLEGTAFGRLQALKTKLSAAA